MTRPEDDLDQLAAWRDTGRPPEERVEDLLRRMTLAEKAGQLRSTWPGGAPANGAAGSNGASGGNGVAPLHDELASAPADWAELIRDGLGQLTRPFGTMPVTAREGAAALARTQREIAAASRFGIPAIAHDECLAGFTAWTAAIFPIPLAWGASFDPELVRQMAVQIGTSMRAVGVHQGLAPVLDVTVDPRWGRTEETIGEDPYLVATVGTAYVRGLESTGLICTLKHFVGYSASRGGRNLAPAAVTSRQVADLLLPPFEMAIRLGGARSVMDAYTDIDGIPTAADPYLLSDVLRDAWDFTGTVVADYFGISFLELLHGVAAGPGQAAGLALAAGVDVELPAARCFGAPLIDAVERGEVAEALVDRAARRVLRQKCELGMLDPSWDPGPGSPWRERVGDVMAKKARLGVDHWGSLDTQIRHIMAPIEETFSQEYPGFEPYPFGAKNWVMTLVRNIVLAEPMLDDFGQCFADVTRGETVHELADSFKLENCVVRERLAGVLSAGARPA